MKARFVELMVLVAILALGVQYAKEENSDLSLNRALSVDGVRIGMSYEEVLEVRGLPQHLEWEAGSTCFHYGEISSRDVGVWFRAGKVVYVAGRVLALDGVPFDPETKTQVMLDRFGPFEDLMTFMSWSPSAGITFEGHDFYSPERPAELTIGLRDVNLPPPWDSEPGRQGNSHIWEPWSLLLVDRLYMGDLCLGESKERVARDGEIPIFDAGYLRGVRRCQDVQHQVYLEHYPATVWLRIGEVPRGAFLLDEPLPATSWLQRGLNHPHLKVTTSEGVVQSVDAYVDDDQLFDALREYRDHRVSP